MLRSLPPGDYLVPLFIGDRQGLMQRQTVHVRVCSCPSGSKCETLSNMSLLVWALSPVCAALLALAGQCLLGAQGLSLTDGHLDRLCVGGRRMNSGLFRLKVARHTNWPEFSFHQQAIM